MPYRIGQKVFAVHFRYRSATLQQFFYTQPFLVTDEAPQFIKFLELQVVTRHAGRPSNEGFLLRGTNGHLFACQYPHATQGVVTPEDYQRFNIHADGDELAEWLLKHPYDYCHLDVCMRKLREMIAAAGPDSVVTVDRSRLRNHDRYIAMVDFHNRIVNEFRMQFPSEPIDRFELILPKEKSDVLIARTDGS
jgi:hypothetical protein